MPPVPVSPRFRAGLALASLLLAFAFPDSPQAAAVATAGRVTAQGLRARDGFNAARELARGWQNDVALVHVEAADTLWGDGSASSWSYVFWSAHGRMARGYTFQSGGRVREFDLPFAFDPPTLEDGWMDGIQAMSAAGRDPRFAETRAAGPLRAMVISNGLWASAGPPRTAWLFGFGDGATNREWVGDALKGTPLDARATAATPTSVSNRESSATPWLDAHRTAALARTGALRDDPSRGLRSRERWLSARDAAALNRLAAQDAAFDTLGRAAASAAGHDLEASLAALAQWRAATAEADSALARSAQRIDDAARDLSAERPTELAVYLSVEGRARPARVSLFVDGAETARAVYGDAEWRALDAGGWAEVARRTARPGTREVRVEIEGADHKIQSATWRGILGAGRLSLLRLKLAGSERSAAGPALDLVATTAP
jgi:hypothetical protein